MIRGLVKSYPVAAPIAAYTIVAFANPAIGIEVSAANGQALPLIGTTGQVDASAAGMQVDVELSAIPLVTLGGPVNAGDRLTSDANGHAIKFAAGASRWIGLAQEPGVAGDIIAYFAAPGIAVLPA